MDLILQGCTAHLVGQSSLIRNRRLCTCDFLDGSDSTCCAARVMSGAEALVAFGIAANVVQFIDFTVKLCDRIREYASGSGLPKKLATQADRLSELLVIFESLNESSNQGVLSGQILARCQTQAQELSDFLDDLKSDGQRSWAKNARKAFKSLNRSDQMEELQGVLDSLVRTLSLQLQADTR